MINFLVLLLFLFLLTPTTTPPKELPSPPLHVVQKPILQSFKVDKVVVHKSKRTLILEGQGRVIKSYKVALGRSPQGHKEQVGDNKTPEGRYIIDRRNPRSANYHKALHISYPNREDCSNAKKKGCLPGGDIFIHGIRKSLRFLGKAHSLTDWTRGCIAVSNDEIDEIFELVQEGTPIEIRP
ncbi:MAG TPA: L,D-transpeptidase family protein [Alphaproteobacteria bacterium]|nr:L,D-transpeptidase family protein [Alphaproteobacteria bacterium]